VEASLKKERDLKSDYAKQLDETNDKLKAFVKVEMDLREKNNGLEKDLAEAKFNIEDKIKKASQQMETEYVSRLKEAQNKITDMENIMTKERTAFHYNLAIAYTKSRMYEEAILSYDKALALNPKDPPIYYNMGLIYDENLDQPDKAITCYQKYLELAPADSSDRPKVQLWIDNCQKRLKEGGKGGGFH
jgi:tetratricopeptide (TPR) repeat protein